MNDQDRILQFLRITGPTLPSKVAKNIGSEVLIASAHLSDLSSQGKVKISYLKIGGSPLYYLPGQEAQIYPFAAGNINPKDYIVLEKLKTRKILRENELDLLSKVALRSLRDFAIPLQVVIDGQREIFWRWYLFSDNETNEMIQSILNPTPLIQKRLEQTPGNKNEINHEIHKKEDSSINISKDNTEIEQRKENSKELIEPLEFKKEKVLGLSDEKQKKLPETVQDKIEVEVKESLNDKETKKIIDSKKKVKGEISSKNKEKSPKKILVKDKFLPIIMDFFQEFEIEVEQEEIIRKNSEIDLIIKVPAVIGKLIFYCKAKSKKRCDEKDLSAAYMQAQIKKLPLLFLYSNEMNKKAQEMLETGAFQNVTVKKIN